MKLITNEVDTFSASTAIKQIFLDIPEWLRPSNCNLDKLLNLMDEPLLSIFLKKCKVGDNKVSTVYTH